MCAPHERADHSRGISVTAVPAQAMPPTSRTMSEVASSVWISACRLSAIATSTASMVMRCANPSRDSGAGSGVGSIAAPRADHTSMARAAAIHARLATPSCAIQSTNAACALCTISTASMGRSRALASLNPSGPVPINGCSRQALHAVCR